MRYIAVLLLVVGLLGCGDGSRLASVDGRAVSAAEFEAYLKLKRIDTQDESRRKALLKQYMQREALAAAIEKSDLLDRRQIQAEVNEFRKEVLISRYFNEFLKQQLSDEAVRKYYEAHKDDFSEQQIHAAHILIRTHSMMTPEQSQAMQARAVEIRGQILKGLSFVEAAQKYSQDKATAANGGDLGWIKQEAMGRQFTDAAFKLQAGELSEPLATPFGYHLIKVLEPLRTVPESIAFNPTYHETAVKDQRMA